MTKTMEEKVALVTGSAMGIGLACAEAFAKAGYITVLADIREPGEQVEKLVAEGHKAVAYRCDVSNTQAVKEMIDWIVVTYGRLDALLTTQAYKHRNAQWRKSPTMNSTVPWLWI